MKLNLKEYIVKLREAIGEGVNAVVTPDDDKYEGFDKTKICTAVHANTAKMKTGNLSVNMTIWRSDNKRIKHVYSIYIVEALSGQTTTIIVDTSSYNHSLLFSNSSENSVDKSFEYVTKIIQHGALELFKKPSFPNRRETYKKKDEPSKED